MEHFFCCRCRRIRNLHPGSHIFRTGFYRVHTQLGKCLECVEADHIRAGEKLVHITA